MAQLAALQSETAFQQTPAAYMQARAAMLQSQAASLRPQPQPSSHAEAALLAHPEPSELDAAAPSSPAHTELSFESLLQKGPPAGSTQAAASPSEVGAGPSSIVAKAMSKCLVRLAMHSELYRCHTGWYYFMLSFCS